MAWLLAAAGAALGAHAAHAQPSTPPRAPTLQVLHWWTSDSERRAAEVLAMRLADEGIVWQDAAIPGGAGLGAGKVLRGRVLAGDAPEVTQIIGVSIREWAALGLLLELDTVAEPGRWASVLFPTVDELIRYRGHVVAAPLGVHRINTLFYHPRLLAQHRLAPPVSWADWVQVAQALKAAGVQPLAQSSEPWQVAALAEALVLGVGGPALHRELFVRQSPQAAADPRLAEALLRLRTMKAWMGPAPVAERPWTEALQQLVRGEAAMLVMGDWAKGELLARGAPGPDIGCTAVPGTGRYHLYSVDTLTMFTAGYAHAAAQEKLARLVVTPALQAEYNAAKGSVPVRRDADPAQMDRCARASWTLFGQDAAMRAPSLVHRMAAGEASKDAIIAELHRFFVDDTISPAEVQRRLATMFRALQPGRGDPARD
ncbi:ABC transporter substrate-binding protein [Ideonella sp.]|uniref:ABC transporter substrate-binding protein n=1 Tax=Ideonella sp. TaxID=1929293 RepID=UPI002B45D2B1|nr:ABC transporter substrate-binding protein [Ideonella sp.]HJV71402.1 ABC transporter substrate-binding protein [Ideonella sp.]